MVPGDASVLGEVVMEGAEPWQVLRHESILFTRRIARGETVSAGEVVIEADSALVCHVTLIAHVEIVITIYAAADDRRRPHHRHAATAHHHHHPHIHPHTWAH